VNDPWIVQHVHRVIDGDSLILSRSKHIGEADNLLIAAFDKEPVRVRLIHVDTPERGEEGWALAKNQLDDWVHEWLGGLALYVAGWDNFGRILGDLKNSDGESATLHLVANCGWPTWQETR
jgi:endonuclease YncB( thermonuclease family)